MKMKMSNMKLSTSSSRSKLFLLSLIFLSLSLFLFLSSLPKKKGVAIVKRVQNDYIFDEKKQSIWFEIIAKGLEKNKMKIGLVNVDDQEVHGLKGEIVNVRFDHVNKDLLKWEDLFPQWIDEDQNWSTPKCPSVPMPIFEDYWGLDVAVVSSPCGETSNNSNHYKGVRDVFRLQVNLVAANLAVKNDIKYIVFSGLCEPMLEIFRCDDLIWNEDDVWIYKPNLRKLREKINMPVGSCVLASPYYDQDKEYRNELSPQTTSQKIPIREAYVTVLHSSENYVCGAIVLAQSLIQTKTTKDLILLADDSISAHSLAGLRAAGWKIKHITRIRCPHAKKGVYNEWNYSKLRLWQLTEYDKLIFIDADLIVLKNMDIFFNYPQISAVWNHKSLFNSGVMLIEPSQCLFKTLMRKRYEITSYNGGDQGFLNEVFTWWHRWPSKLNSLKFFPDKNVTRREIPKSAVAVHYLGVKPWMCYRDYDCNWDTVERQVFASDLAHRKWWFFHDSMDEGLQRYCALTKGMDLRIQKWRKMAQNASLDNGYWKIKVMDPRQYMLE